MGTKVFVLGILGLQCVSLILGAVLKNPVQKSKRDIIPGINSWNSPLTDPWIGGNLGWRQNTWRPIVSSPLVSSPLVSSPVVSSPLVTQYWRKKTPITVSQPIIDSHRPYHGSIGSGISLFGSSPLIGNGYIGGGYPINNNIIGSPFYGSSSLLDGSSLIGGSPILESPVIGGSSSFLGGSSLIGGPSILGSPLIGGTSPLLGGSSLISGSSILGSPVIGGTSSLLGGSSLIGGPSILGPPLIGGSSIIDDPALIGSGLDSHIW